MHRIFFIFWSDLVKIPGEITRVVSGEYAVLFKKQGTKTNQIGNHPDRIAGLVDTSFGRPDDLAHPCRRCTWLD